MLTFFGNLHFLDRFSNANPLLLGMVKQSGVSSQASNNTNSSSSSCHGNMGLHATKTVSEGNSHAAAAVRGGVGKSSGSDRALMPPPPAPASTSASFTSPGNACCLVT